MLGLTLNRLKVTSLTNDGAYSTEIPFLKGLNIIRAENSSGKSTCINAIAYALGLEAILGPSRKKPFPRAMYKLLESSKTDTKSHLVHQSFVELEIESRLGEIVTLKRDVEGYSDKVTVIDDEGNEEEFFLGSAGTVGAAKSEKGFHFWLEKFLDWNLPSLVTYDGKPTRLYLECIFPLFFIEQKRGWSELQANTPTHYSIKGVKKAALEYCLGVESYGKKNRIAEINSHITDLENQWDRIISSAASLAEFGRLRLQLESTIDQESFFPLVNFFVPHHDQSTAISAYLAGLQSVLEDLSNKIKTWPHFNEVAELSSKKRAFQRTADTLAQSEEGFMLSIEKVNSKVSNIRLELDRYKQLKRLHDVGSKIEMQLEVKECPVCESEMYDSLTKTNNRSRPLSVIQNIEYLKNQVDFYSGIKKRHEKELIVLRAEASRIQVSITDIQNKIDELRTDEAAFIELYGSDLKKKVELENEINDLSRLEQKQTEFNERASEIREERQRIGTELKTLKKRSSDDVSFKILNDLKTKLTNNLTAFGYKTANEQYLKISEQTLRPELDGYDIVADSSASDYIRIIWSYTLALLELGISENNVKHGGFVVFDEPRQHETNKASFASLLEKSNSLMGSGGQVIIATSISNEELETYELKEANFTIFNDGEYILQKEKS